MSPVAGDRLSPHEIRTPIGMGGLGEADKARDWRIIIVRLRQRP